MLVSISDLVFKINNKKFYFLINSMTKKIRLLIVNIKIHWKGKGKFVAYEFSTIIISLRSMMLLILFKY